jgi:large subunit ribosomal protein L17
VKRHERRLGDAGKTAFLELLKQGETKVRAKAPAPAPRLEEPPKEEAPAAESPPAAPPENPETKS